jgi:hypothetical protein
MALVAMGVLTACGGRAPGASTAPAGSAGAVPVDAGAPAPAPAPAPPPVAMACDPGPDRAPFNPYDQRRTLTGRNGSFTDGCDGGGNLVNHQCEAKTIRCPGGGGRQGHHKRMDPDCWERTGQVVADTVDCDGRCKDGTCDTRCPKSGDMLTIVALDPLGQVTFASAADPRRFTCTLAWDDKKDAFDCKGGFRVGDSFPIKGTGLSTTMCTGGTWGAVGEGRCTYSGCRFVGP